MVPVIVLTIWMAIYLYEVITVRLKLQEAARFATWEFTAYPLHDYAEGTGSRFDDVRDEVQTLTQELYEDLDSSDRATEAAAAGSNSFLATGWELGEVRCRESSPPNLTGEVIGELGLSILLTVEAWVESLLMSIDNPYAVGPVIWATRSLPSIDRRWGFNTQGYVTTTVQAEVENLWVPTSFRLVTALSFESDRWVRPRIRLRETSALLADSWRLNDGRDVGHTDRDGGYYEQVDRIFLLNESRARPMTSMMQAIERLDEALSLETLPDATEPIVVSRNHHTGQDGRVTLQVDGGRSTFDTTPLTVPHPSRDSSGGVGSGTWEPYQETLDNRGDNFMGCEEPMNATCGAGLGTENPFGDGVHWPPPGR